MPPKERKRVSAPAMAGGAQAGGGELALGRNEALPPLTVPSAPLALSPPTVPSLSSPQAPTTGFLSPLGSPTAFQGGGGLSMTDHTDEDIFSWLLFNSDYIDGSSLSSLAPGTGPSISPSTHPAPTGAVLPTSSSCPQLVAPLSLDELTKGKRRVPIASSPSTSSQRRAKALKTGSAEPPLILDDEEASSSDARTPRGGGGGELTEEEKRKRRLQQNRESARESRLRRLQKLDETAARLKRLEAENLNLKLRLKVGKEALQREREEKDRIKQQMGELLQNGAPEEEIAKFIDMYKHKYSDYGRDRGVEIEYHLRKMKELILPTQVTKMCLYSVVHGHAAGEEEQVQEQQEESELGGEEGAASLWKILAKELGLTEEQQQQLLERRMNIRKLVGDLQESLSIVDQLREVTRQKNVSLDSEVSELQRILTPTQTAKFILWVKKNPAFMYMLNKFTDFAFGVNSKSSSSPRASTTGQSSDRGGTSGQQLEERR